MIEEYSEVYARIRGVAIKLMEQHMIHREWQDSLNKCGVDIYSPTGSFEPFDIVLDLLRVPIDNSSEVFDFHNQRLNEGYVMDDMFCRDFMYEELKGDNLSATDIVDNIIKIVKDEGWARIEDEKNPIQLL